MLIVSGPKRTIYRTMNLPHVTNWEDFLRLVFLNWYFGMFWLQECWPLGFISSLLTPVNTVLTWRNFWKHQMPRDLTLWKKVFEFVTNFHLNIKSIARKVDIRNAIVQHFVERGIFDESALSMVVKNVKKKCWTLIKIEIIRI